ncbi:MAG: ABC transporter permease [Bacteroidia bacterium]
MTNFKLALRNLLGAGMKTWLNVIVLSMSFVIIIFYNGMMDGWNQQARNENIAWEMGGGQLWHNEYDPYDLFTLNDAHASVPAGIDMTQAVPELIIQASVYPQGRMLNVLLKGIPVDQKVLSLPTAELKNDGAFSSAIIGKRMAENAKLKQGDQVLIRWRDKNGTFDAKQISIVHVFDTDNPSVDQGQIWMDFAELERMTGLENEATLITLAKDYQAPASEHFESKSLGVLMKNIDDIIASKKGSMVIVYMMLMGIALLAIFDTQVLSIFRRQKEIGTYIALGMTRSRVVGLFTIEGGAISLLAAGVGALYGIPLFAYLASNGIDIPTASAEGAGITMASKIYPVYGLGLVLGTTLIVVIAATIVSYMPARKIARLNPTEALKGKLQ